MEHIQQGDEVGSLNMQDTPQDASATMCLVVQSSDLEEQETVTQFYGHHWEQRDRVREQQKEQGGHHQALSELEAGRDLNGQTYTASKLKAAPETRTLGMISIFEMEYEGSIPNTSLMCLTRLPPPAKSRNKLREEHKFKMKLVTITKDASTVQSTSSSVGEVTLQAVTGTQSEDENGNMNMESQGESESKDRSDAEGLESSSVEEENIDQQLVESSVASKDDTTSPVDSSESVTAGVGAVEEATEDLSAEPTTIPTPTRAVVDFPPVTASTVTVDTTIKDRSDAEGLERLKNQLLTQQSELKKDLNLMVEKNKSLENEIEKLCSEREFLKLDNIHLITRVKTLEMEHELDKRLLEAKIAFTRTEHRKREHKKRGWLQEKDLVGKKPENAKWTSTTDCTICKLQFSTRRSFVNHCINAHQMKFHTKTGEKIEKSGVTDSTSVAVLMSEKRLLAERELKEKVTKNDGTSPNSTGLTKSGRKRKHLEEETKTPSKNLKKEGTAEVQNSEDNSKECDGVDIADQKSYRCLLCSKVLKNKNPFTIGLRNIIDPHPCAELFGASLKFQ